MEALHQADVAGEIRARHEQNANRAAAREVDRAEAHVVAEVFLLGTSRRAGYAARLADGRTLHGSTAQDGRTFERALRQAVEELDDEECTWGSIVVVHARGRHVAKAELGFRLPSYGALVWERMPEGPRRNAKLGEPAR